MGFIFDIQQANIVAFLTTSSKRTPRVSYGELDTFLACLSGQAEQSPESLFSEALISTSKRWITEVRTAATRSRDDLRAAQVPWNDRVPDHELATRLALLRSLLSDYGLFGLALGSWQDDVRLRAFTNHAAIDSKHHALFLVPLGWYHDGIKLLDPFPAVALAAERSSDWPGIVFWTRNGTAAFATLDEAEVLYFELRPALPSTKELDAILERWRRRSQKTNILQLSDLHFGNKWAQEKEPYLSTHLHSISSDVARVVITGDLFNEPRRDEALAFQSFRTSLERERGEQALVIPGNHDQKWLGNLQSDLREIAKVEWSPVFVDDKTGCVFFCFDSSRDADLARGKVNSEQRLRVATEFDKLRLARPEIKDYLRVALVHHHPFSFETPKETLVSRLFEKIGITDEYFLKMEDADGFLTWCANRGVGLILHGHKHVPRYREERVEKSDHNYHHITTVGCGTSLGAEGKPLSYNTLAWNAPSRRWSVAFFTDPGDGSGFVQECLAVGGNE